MCATTEHEVFVMAITANTSMKERKTQKADPSQPDLPLHTSFFVRNVSHLTPYSTTIGLALHTADYGYIIAKSYYYIALI